MNAPARTHASGMLAAYFVLAALLAGPGSVTLGVCSLTGVTVGIDPGHGGGDNGTSNNHWGGPTLLEKTVNLHTALYLQSWIEADSGACELTRSTDIYPSWEFRYQVLNRQDVDYRLSIHYNADSLGIENYHVTYVYGNDSTGVYECDLSDAVFACSLAAYISAATLLDFGAENCSPFHPGVAYAADRIANNENVEPPSVLTEVSFLSNDTEASWLVNSPSYVTDIAHGIYRGVCAYHGSVAGASGEDDSVAVHIADFAVEGDEVVWDVLLERNTTGCRLVAYADEEGSRQVVVSEEIPAEAGRTEYRIPRPAGDYQWIHLEETEESTAEARWEDVAVANGTGRSGGGSATERGRPPVVVVGSESDRHEMQNYCERVKDLGREASYEIVPTLTDERVRSSLQNRDRLERIWERPERSGMAGKTMSGTGGVLLVAPSYLEDDVEWYALDLEARGFSSEEISVFLVDYPGSDDSSDVAARIRTGDEQYVLIFGNVFERNGLNTDMPIPWIPDTPDHKYERIWFETQAASLSDYEANSNGSRVEKSIGFLPVDDESDMTGYQLRLWDYEWSLATYGYGKKVGTWAYDIDHSGNSGPAIRLHMQALLDWIYPWWEKYDLWRTDFASDYAAQPWAEAALSNGRAIVTMLSSAANVEDYGRWLRYLDELGPFSGDRYSHLLSLCCWTNGFDNFHGTAGLQAVELLLTDWSGGGVTSIGPTRGFLGSYYFRYAEEYFRILESTPGPIAAGDLNKEVRNALLDRYPDDELMPIFCKIMVLLGDPTTPVFGPYSEVFAGVEGSEGQPSATFRTPFFLGYARPNPFNPRTVIPFSLPENSRAEVRIYAVSGRLVRTLLDRELPAGQHEAVWDGTTDAGRVAGSGVYFYRLRAGGKAETKRMVLIR